MILRLNTRAAEAYASLGKLRDVEQVTHDGLLEVPVPEDWAELLEWLRLEGESDSDFVLRMIELGRVGLPDVKHLEVK